MLKNLVNLKSGKAIFIAAVLLLFPKAALAQRINISLENTTVREAIDYLQSNYSYSISVRSDEVNIEKRITIKARNAELINVLNQIFTGQNVEYVIKGTFISVSAKKAQPKPKKKAITGKVTDENSAPLPGAVVIEKGHDNAVITDSEGRYSLVPGGASPELTFTFFGYVDKTIKVGDKDVIDVEMTPEYISLNDVVVVGYGTMSKRDITSAIGSFKPKDVERRDVLSPDQFLQGRIAGVNISTSSGVPGSNSRVSIRGIGSLNAGNEPLYVIDGIPITSTSGDTGVWSAGESMDGLASINPADIESIDVLKDAASAAIYGSRATNGVIIITTKSGRKGAPLIGIDANIGIGRMPRTDKLAMADGDLLIEVFNEGIDNYNRQYGASIERMTNPMPGKPAHNWLNDVLRTAFSRTLSLSVSGGNDNVTYYLSGGAKHIEGTAIDNDWDQYNLKSNVSGRVRKWLSLGMNTMLSYSKNSRVASGYSGLNVIKASVEQYPWDEPFLPNGEWATSHNVLVNSNPLQAIRESDIWIKTYRALSSAFLQFHISKGLDFKTNFGADVQSLEEHAYFSSRHPSGAKTNDNPMGGKLIDSRKNRVSLLWDNTITYDGNLGGNLNYALVLGHSLQVDDSSIAAQTGYGFPSSSFDVNSVAASYDKVTTGRTEYGLQSFFGRINLNYMNRYICSLTFRTDGSSKFAPENRWGYFPSASLGWNVNEEKWWTDKSTSLKVRTSIGATGNQGGINAYAYQHLASGGFNYNGINGLGLSRPGNRDLRWELAVQENLGADISFFKGALSATIDLFNKDTYDLLYNKPTMISTGYASIISNIGSMNNKGLEISLGANAGKGDFRWHSDFNISLIRNKLTGLLGGEEIIRIGNFHALQVGREVGSFYMMKMNGIYQHDEDVPKYLYDNEGVRAGDVIYDDYNKDGKITDDDRQFVGSANPKFSGGFNNTFTYKNLELSLFMTYSYGNMIYEHLTGQLRLGMGQFPQMKWVCEGRWTGPGTTNTVPRAIYNYSWNSTRFVSSTRFLHEASYLRLRSATLGYNLPDRFLRKIKADKIRLYLQCDNLFVLTKWPYLDPEVSISGNALNYGYDWFNPGQPRTITIGANIKF